MGYLASYWVMTWSEAAQGKGRGPWELDLPEAADAE
jgi:hypothetical protein